MRVALLTREYPPEVYGGAGVHVEYLARELSRLRGRHRPRVGRRAPCGAHGGGHDAGTRWRATRRELAALRAVSIDLTMAAGGGRRGRALAHLVRELRRASREAALRHPARRDRPLPRAAAAVEGGAARRRLRLSSFCERTALENADAVIAVSRGTGEDILRVYPAIDPEHVHVIYNGIDTDEYKPDPRTDVLERHGDRPRPAVRRVRRAHHAPEGRRSTCSRRRRSFDRERAARALRRRARHARARRRGRAPRRRAAGTRDGVIWIDEMLPKPDVIQLLSHATVFACPSIYEPLGIVNLEAMACEAAVVATATGGIVEVVVDDETGFLVPFEPSDDGVRTPVDPAGFAAAIAQRVNALVRDTRASGSDGQGRATAGARTFRMAGDRRADLRALPAGRRNRIAGRGARPLLYSENSMSASKWKPPSPGSSSWSVS